AMSETAAHQPGIKTKYPAMEPSLRRNDTEDRRESQQKGKRVICVGDSSTEAYRGRGTAGARTSD
ncbi:MAG: hypothetical protein RDV41_11405, partial [Planctomycetota bacterium]|nr:hypothetical protein [Planctomycetota bacterium]